MGQLVALDRRKTPKGNYEYLIIDIDTHVERIIPADQVANMLRQGNKIINTKISSDGKVLLDIKSAGDITGNFTDESHKNYEKSAEQNLKKFNDIKCNDWYEGTGTLEEDQEVYNKNLHDTYNNVIREFMKLLNDNNKLTNIKFSIPKEYNGNNHAPKDVSDISEHSYFYELIRINNEHSVTLVVDISIEGITEHIKHGTNIINRPTTNYALEGKIIAKVVAFRLDKQDSIVIDKPARFEYRFMSGHPRNYTDWRSSIDRYLSSNIHFCNAGYTENAKDSNEFVYKEYTKYINSMLYYVLCKTTKGKLTKEQLSKLIKITGCGAIRGYKERRARVLREKELKHDENSRQYYIEKEKGKINGDAVKDTLLNAGESVALGALFLVCLPLSPLIMLVEAASGNKEAIEALGSLAVIDGLTGD